MKFLLALGLAGGVAFVGTPPISAASPRPFELSENKVLCSYFVFGQRRDICSNPPLEEAKKACDKQASEQRREKTECACTDDQNFIQGACD